MATPKRIVQTSLRYPKERIVELALGQNTPASTGLALVQVPKERRKYLLKPGAFILAETINGA